LVAKKWSGEIKIGEPDRIDELEWFSLDRLPDNTLPYIKTVLENYKKGIAFSEAGWE